MILGGLAIVLGLALVWRKREKISTNEINYKAFFILGITFLPFGVVLSVTTENPGLIGISGLGAAYIAIGLSNRDKW